ncbi:MAG: hypothetical protein KF812_00780 [Fimbriimonadaceae bacterium]|nr:hypothetical protein [Fimbriimonadaceae bacterium]
MKNITRNIFVVSAVCALAISQAAVGWRQTVSGRIGADSVVTRDYTLSAGDYVIYLEGTNAYSDLDIFVYDGYGNLCGKDELIDNEPLVEFSLDRGGRGHVEIVNNGVSQRYTGYIRQVD